ncbi:MAG TPA: hypothetical protein VFT22_12305 [Kofleriaceae bacterium]|nr:hypothetical protein [Kofleriaceae bacterium]
MQRLAWLVIAACAHPAAPRPVPAAAPAPSVTPAAVPAPASPWAAVPVRVMTWTPRGTQQIGMLPGAVPDPLPAVWYVEPVHRLTGAAFDRLIELVRSEHVPGLSLRNQQVAPWLGRLADLPGLAALVLDGSDLDGAALAAMQPPATLRRLYLAHTAIDDAAIAQVADRYPELEVIDVEGTAIGDAGARAIARLTGLVAVNLSATRITDEGGAALAALARLEIADLGNTRVGAKTVAALRRLPVRELFLDGTRVRGEVAQLAPLAPRLVRFDISATAHHPGDPELAWLASAPNLEEVGVSGARLHDPLAQALARLPRLRELRMAELPITGATIKALAARDDLEEVDLAGTPVDDASAAALVGSPHMRIARLDGTPITDAALAGTPGPALTELYVSHTAIGDRSVAFLDGIAHLAALGLGHTQLGDAGVARLGELAQHGKLAELHTLVLSRVQASPGALARLGARLAAAGALERLYLDQTHADDVVMVSLAPAATLRVLHVDGSDVSDAGAGMLQQLDALEELTIGDTRVRAAIADLSAWPRLRTLSVIGLAIGDAAVRSMAARASLVVLDLSATDVRDPSPLAALPHLRTLGVAQTRLSPAGVQAIKRLAARGVEIVR